jgi:diguanylate cyclase
MSYGFTETPVTQHLDRFKYINDSLGHAIGGDLLQSVSKRLLTSVRGSDTVS